MSDIRKVLRDYAIKCLDDIVAEALKPIVIEQVGIETIKNFNRRSGERPRSPDDLQVLCSIIENKYFQCFNTDVFDGKRSNLSRIRILRDVRNTKSHAYKELSSLKIKEMFLISISLLREAGAKEYAKQVEELEQQFNQEKIFEEKIPTLYNKVPASNKNEPLYCLPASRSSTPSDLLNPIVEIAKCLVSAAKQQKTLIYQKICDIAKLRDMDELFKSGYLDEINDISDKHAGVLLSVLVVGSKSKKPGPPFFDKAVRQWGRDLSSQSQMDFFHDECKRVYQAASLGKLDFLLEDTFLINIDKPDNDDKLPYDMGNIGDLLKHGMMSEFIRWWASKKTQKDFVFLDPFCGCRWAFPANDKALTRLYKLRDKHGSDFAIFSAQPDIGDCKYYGSTHVAINQAIHSNLSPVIHISDRTQKKIMELTTLDEEKFIKKLECEKFSANNGYSILDSIRGGHINADMVLIDPFYDLNEIKRISSKIVETSKKTAVVLFMLIKLNKDDGKTWEEIHAILPRDKSVFLSCLPLYETEIDGESNYGIEVILISDLIDDDLRKSLKDYTAALTDIIDESITCE